MIFYNKPFNIPKSQGILAIRISNRNPHENFVDSFWDFGRKSVAEFKNHHGIYAINLINFTCGFDWFFRVLLAQCRNIENVMIVFLNIDKNSVIEDKSPMELSFRCANILKELSLTEFRQYLLSHKDFNDSYVLKMIDDSIKASEMLCKGNYDSWAKIMGQAKWDMYQRLGNNFEITPIQVCRNKTIEQHIMDCRKMVEAIDNSYQLRNSQSPETIIY